MHLTSPRLASPCLALSGRAYEAHHLKHTHSPLLPHQWPPQTRWQRGAPGPAAGSGHPRHRPVPTLTHLGRGAARPEQGEQQHRRQAAGAAPAGHPPLGAACAASRGASTLPPARPPVGFGLRVPAPHPPRRSRVAAPPRPPLSSTPSPPPPPRVLPWAPLAAATRPSVLSGHGVSEVSGAFPPGS